MIVRVHDMSKVRRDAKGKVIRRGEPYYIPVSRHPGGTSAASMGAHYRHLVDYYRRAAETNFDIQRRPLNVVENASVYEDAIFVIDSIPALKYYDMLGSRASRNIEEGNILCWADIEITEDKNEI